MHLQPAFLGPFWIVSHTKLPSCEPLVADSSFACYWFNRRQFREVHWQGGTLEKVRVTSVRQTSKVAPGGLHKAETTVRREQTIKSA